MDSSPHHFVLTPMDSRGLTLYWRSLTNPYPLFLPCVFISMTIQLLTYFFFASITSASRSFLFKNCFQEKNAFLLFFEKQFFFKTATSTFLAFHVFAFFALVHISCLEAKLKLNKISMVFTWLVLLLQLLLTLVTLLLLTLLLLLLTNETELLTWKRLKVKINFEGA